MAIFVVKDLNVPTKKLLVVTGVAYRGEITTSEHEGSTTRVIPKKKLDNRVSPFDGSNYEIVISSLIFISDYYTIKSNILNNGSRSRKIYPTKTKA